MPKWLRHVAGLLGLLFCIVVAAIPSVAGSGAQPQGKACRILFPDESNAVGNRMGEMPSGPFHDVVVKIFADAGVAMETAPLTPWNRSVELVMREVADGLAVSMKTRDRTPTLHMIGPFMVRPWAIYKLAGTGLSPGGSSVVGVPMMFADLEPVKNAVARVNAISVELPIRRLARMLAEKRVDTIFITRDGMEFWSKETGVQMEEVPGTEVLIPTFIAINKKSHCASQRDKLQAAMDRWIASGGRAEFDQLYSNRN